MITRPARRRLQPVLRQTPSLALSNMTFLAGSTPKSWRCQSQTSSVTMRRVYDTRSLSDRQYLIYADPRDLLNLVGGGPSDFDHIHYLRLSDPKVQPEIALRHETSAT